jgi:hypothetical protein
MEHPLYLEGNAEAELEMAMQPQPAQRALVVQLSAAEPRHKHRGLLHELKLTQTYPRKSTPSPNKSEYEHRTEHHPSNMTVPIEMPVSV